MGRRERPIVDFTLSAKDACDNQAHSGTHIKKRFYNGIDIGTDTIEFECIADVLALSFEPDVRQSGRTGYALRLLGENDESCMFGILSVVLRYGKLEDVLVEVACVVLASCLHRADSSRYDC